MKKFSYVLQLCLLIVWIFVVGAIFSLISEKQVAGVIAGSGFIFIPVLILASEFRREIKSKIHIGAALIFLSFSALPIFLLRVLNWGIEFKDLSLFGIASDTLHRSSNILYTLMIISVIICIFQERKLKNK